MMRTTTLGIAVAAALCTQVGCAEVFPKPVTPPSPAQEPRPLSGVTWRRDMTNGLTEADRRKYYLMDEGIQYLPVDMMMVMKRSVTLAIGVNDRDLSVYDERLFEKPERYGLYPNPWNPKGPPLGITESTDPDYLPMGGFNCATCHTTVMKRTTGAGGASRSVAFVVDGGSSTFAVGKFFPELIFSLAKTVFNYNTFEAFYADYQARVRTRDACEASACQDKACQDNGFWCEAGAKPRPKAFLAASAEEEHANDAALEAERHSDAFEALRAEAEAHFWDRRFHAAAERYEGHLADVLRERKILPSQRKHKEWGTSLTDGAYPTAEELNTKGEVWFYLVKRLLHFKDLASYAGNTGGGGVDLGRSDPWSVTKNMLAANGSALQAIGITAQSRSPAQFPDQPSASVNTPHIWGYDKQRWIFWSGVTNSMVERNIAQGVALLTDFNWKTWETTVSVSNLHRMMDAYASRIEPPAWPVEVLGAVDQGRADAGRKVFQRECLSCHHEVEIDRGPGGMVAPYLNAGADPWYTRGQDTPFYRVDFFNEVLARWIPVVKARAYQDEGLCRAGEVADACVARLRPEFERGREFVVWKGPREDGIAAKPLYGIWATAPFLHNGSVPSLRQLLTPPGQRARMFVVGNYEYDPVEMGFRYDLGSQSTPPLTTPNQGPIPAAAVYYGNVFDTRKTGNDNLGHEYGTCLSDQDKEALLEFLKVYRKDTRFDEAAPGPATCCGSASCGAGRGARRD